MRAHLCRLNRCCWYQALLLHSHAVQDDLTALLLFAQYKCGQQTYGVKLLGTAKRMPGKDPRAGQVGEVEVAPSSGAVQQPAAAAATATVHTAGKVVAGAQTTLSLRAPSNAQQHRLCMAMTASGSSAYCGYMKDVLRKRCH